MTTYVVPTSQSVATLLQMLYGHDLSASDSAADDVTSYRVATFVDDANNVVAGVVCDIKFVVYSGAALSMIPSGGADDMILHSKATDAVLDNFHEVMNIYSKLFMTETGAHLRLGKIIDADQAAQSATMQTLYSTATAVGFEIDVPEYGKGKMMVVVS